MSGAGDVWVVAEHEGGDLLPVTLELLADARVLADQLSAQLSVLILGDEGLHSGGSILGYESRNELIDQLSQHGADEIQWVQHELLGDYTSDTHVNVLTDLCRADRPELILLAATSDSEELAARCSVRLQGALISDCVQLELDADGALVGSKPLFDDSVYATLQCQQRPQMATLRPDAGEARRFANRSTASVKQIVPVLDPQVLSIQLQEFIRADASNLSILEAEKIVAGGAGLANTEGVQLLESLAKILGACSAASRVAVDMGLMPRHKQVGLSGLVVQPKLYLAFGISGASYHLAGMKDSDIIMAVNNDPAADIFKVADFSAVGDLFEVMPALFKRLEHAAPPLQQVNAG